MMLKGRERIGGVIKCKNEKIGLGGRSRALLETGGSFVICQRGFVLGGLNHARVGAVG